jgi:hypothetical protein
MDKTLVTVTLDVNQVNLIFAALTDQPYKNVAKLIAELDEQLKTQLQQHPSGPLTDKLV